MLGTTIPFAFFLVSLALGFACSPSRLSRAWLALPPSLRKGFCWGRTGSRAGALAVSLDGF